jgi:hypothetical protein
MHLAYQELRDVECDTDITDKSQSSGHIPCAVHLEPPIGIDVALIG